MKATDEKTINLLNWIYRPLHERATALSKLLREKGLDARLGWYNMHYRGTGGGEYAPDYFPIPVISIAGLCDVEFNIDTVNVTAKLTRKDSLEKNIDGIGVSYEAYGVNDYLNDFRNAETTTEQMRRAIAQSDEKEVFFGFLLPQDIKADGIAEFIERLRLLGFFY
ncbi:MAG: hypothetical protein HFJ21_02290 [Clostridia bacterium]|jgi:hypothetical protein|nr:hypothetical protein [Clostridia bacterium]MCI9459276.1 hypothetical protein [Clostridia bacterium]